MTLHLRLLGVASSVLLLFLASAVPAQDVPTNVTVQFGNDEIGSPFPPPTGHDHSGHASHKMFPRTVTIARGGSVTFEVDEIHQPAIYAPGKLPKDIVVDVQTLEDLTLSCLPQTLTDFVINDPNGRVALAPPQSCEEADWTTPPGTFDQPGQYLVICTTRPHFVDDNMYGWVVVK
jgi:plastocyanin